MFRLSLLLLGCANLVLSKTVTYNWDITWVTASPDGFARPVIGINGKWPCPTVHVDLGDRLVVHVNNALGNQSTSLHWHGLHQYGTPSMDGSSGATQCPIPPGSQFTYDFIVYSTFLAMNVYANRCSGDPARHLLVSFGITSPDPNRDGTLLLIPRLPA